MGLLGSAPDAPRPYNFSYLAEELVTTGLPYRIGDLTLVDDLTPADWLVEGLRTFAVNVNSLVPAGFAAYARVLHPAYKRDGEAEVPVSWHEIASAKGRVLHPEVQFESVVGVERYSQSGDPWLWDTEPDVGELPAELAVKLTSVLARYTATPKDCWFAVWDGRGDVEFPPFVAPTFHLPGRDYFLLSGPIIAAAQSVSKHVGHRSANLWWPTDKAWCVATEIDLDSTYVGASVKCVNELLGVPGLEVLVARAEDGTDASSDHINPDPRRA